MSGHLRPLGIDAPRATGGQRHRPPSQPESLAWRVITTEGEIDGLATDWRRLLPREAAPFLTFGWNRAWYRHYADARDEPILFVVSLGGLPSAIIPAYPNNIFRHLSGAMHLYFHLSACNILLKSNDTIQRNH